MGKFVVLSSRSSLRCFASNENFIGGIYISAKDIDFCININCLPSEVEIIYVECKEVFIDYIYEHYTYIKNHKLIMFKISNQEIVELDTKEIETEQRIKLKSMRIINDLPDTFKEVSNHTRGEIGIEDADALINIIITNFIDNESQINAVEIGSWQGCSTFFYASALKVVSSEQALFCIDTWGGSKGAKHHSIADHINIFANFQGYMKHFKVYDIIKPLVMKSEEAFQILKDNYFDIIFIDGDHRFNFVKEDIIEAIKKLKVGGLLIGHDCECYKQQLPSEFISSHTDVDCAIYDHVLYHCGVIRALSEVFRSNYNIFKDSSVWYKKITQEDKDLYK